MKSVLVILFGLFVVLVNSGPSPQSRRQKRDAVGALEILTNNAQPIHADVKIDNLADPSASTISDVATEKPCPKPNVPSSIEMGTVFQVSVQEGGNGDSTHIADDTVPANVPPPSPPPAPPVPKPIPSQVTPPKDVATIYATKSARKSWPLTSRLDLIRSVTRIFTLIVLVFSGILEFYPLLTHLFNLL